MMDNNDLNINSFEQFSSSNDKVELPTLVHQVEIDAPYVRATSNIDLNHVKKHSRALLVKNNSQNAKVRNLIAGVLMMLSAIFNILPFILNIDTIKASFGESLAIDNALNFQGNYNVIQRMILFFGDFANQKANLTQFLPAFMILIMIALFVVILCVSIYNTTWKSCGMSTLFFSFIIFVVAVVLLLMHIVGFQELGMKKIPFSTFANDWIHSANFVIILSSFSNLVLSLVARILIKRDKVLKKD